jgi:transcriptional regulator with XRE-family HTH domain
VLQPRIGVDDVDAMTFVEKIEQLRKLRGLSQSDLAAAAGISQPRISEWKRDDSRGPSLPVALSIARALGVPLDYLADDAQDDPPASLNAAEQQAVLLTRALALSVEEVARRLAGNALPINPSVPPIRPVGVSQQKDITHRPAAPKRERGAG